MKKRYKVLIGLLVLLIIIGITGFILIQRMNENLDEVVLIPIETPDLSLINDGVYEGSYQATPIDVMVKVTISNHQITDIEITKHVNGMGGDGENVIDDVILNQNLDVDLVSGATYSSKVILLAIMDALS